MTNYVTGSTIKTLREKKGLTQRQLAQQLMVSDKTISKWETQKGLPDISLLEPLAAALGISVAELLSGDCITNANRCGNMLRGSFYVCPVCGNVIRALGQGAFSCCGIALPPLQAEEPDEAHRLCAERIETDWYLTWEHPMEKDHFLSFAALLTSDGLQMKKLYPEQTPQLRFASGAHGMVYWYCNRHGLFAQKL